MLALSSTPRTLIVAKPFAVGVQVDDQLAGVPDVRRHVVPPSVEISTRVTTPPPVSVELPEIVTATFSGATVPGSGDVIVAIGAVVSVDADAGTRPGCSVVGCALMSANRFTIDCLTAESDVPLPES